MSLKDRIDAVRARRPFLDHLLRMQEHVGRVKANQQAGAITYFGFLSVFPILALAFAVVGFVSRINPWPDVDVDQVMLDVINEVLPGIASADLLATVRDNAPGIASVGLVVVLYSGLGWLSAMRTAMLVVFELPADEQPNFLVGKLRDLISLVLIGVTMLLAVGTATAVNAASSRLLGLVGLEDDMRWLLQVVAVAVGLVANTVLFYWIFRLLARPPLPSASLWKGALLGAVGFEALKQVATLLLAATKEQPAFQVFGIALVLVVWINYFARVLMYAASFAHTAPRAVAQREAAAAALREAEEAVLARAVTERAQAIARTEIAEQRGSRVAPFLIGAGIAGVLAAAIRRKSAKWE